MDEKHKPATAQGTPQARESAPEARRGGESKDARADKATGGSAPAGSAASLLPAVTLPTGGGAIRGIGEKFEVSAVTGTASLSVPLPASPGRNGQGPEVSLSYSSGAGNGPFGLGFQLSVPSITRKTDKGLPRYLDDAESDTFVLSGAEDLVPKLDAQGTHTPRDRGTHLAYPYRPRIEGLFARIERWVDKSSKDAHWRVTTPDNRTHIYGVDADARIADPAVPEHVFTWLLSETRDDKGNVTAYRYKSEDGAGVDSTKASERSRFEYSGGAANFRATAQRYLKRVLYGNASPNVAADFLFELVFDYGEHSAATPSNVPTPVEARAWPVRQDPLSSYRAGFEVRTYRLCRRVLMFHRTNPARDALFVRTTELEYEPGPAFTYLTGVVQAGFVFDAASSTWKRGEMPRLSLGYQRPELNDQLAVLPEASLEGLAGGADGSRKQWVDLNGEGIPGLLIDQDGCWFYKENRGNGELSAPRRLSAQPYPSTLVGGLQTLEDVDGDGRLELVAREPNLSGYFTRASDGTFEPLRTFASMPHIDWKDPNLRVIDLDGDGHADILITEDQAFVWYRSLAKSGFEPARRVSVPFDENEGPRVVFADAQQTIQLADMSGDGLVDIVRIRNGAVCYWPNLGYGRFGAKVTLENSPIFAQTEEFHATRVRLADIDGSGTTDLIYLGAKNATLYFNESGNRLAAGVTIHSLPPVDSLSSVSAVDLLGTGTSCLVWSSPLGNPRRNVFYVDILGSKKPHLLVEVSNNLGATTRTTYVSSTKFYLEDKAAGIPWLTRLSFPVQVVERVERTDAISGGTLVSRYRYRHGFFDGFEREFRGFARVDQFDAEDFAPAGSDPLLYQSPVHSISWFHTGAWLEKERLELALQSEYFQGGPPSLLVKDTILPTGMSVQDEREAARSLKGSPLRHEVYADDGSPDANKPYVISEQNQEVRLLQNSRGENRYGVFFAHAREAVTITSERNLDDPRVAQELVLDVDDFGAVTRKASIVYGRATGEPEQRKSYVTVAEADFTHQSDADDVYRIGTEIESRQFEVTGLTLVMGQQRLTDVAALRSQLDALNPGSDLDFDVAPSTGVQRRLLHRQQRTFYTDDASSEATLGVVGLRALPHRTYQLALTAGQVTSLVIESQTLSGTALDPVLLVSEGKYQPRSGQCWSISSRAIFSPVDFYLPTSALDAFGGTANVVWDAFKLLPTSLTDALGNVVSSDNDYRVLAPRLVTDPNLNRSEVAFDALGMVVATAVMGKAGAVPAEGDTLGDPTTRLEYDLLRFQTQGKPALVHTFAREQHGAANPRFQETFAYSDGFGRIAMQKVQAEPGEVPGVGTVSARWVGTGRTVFNNKGNPVKQYEPFFSATSDFEDEAAIVQTGVTPIIHYDSLDRVVRTELPDGSETRIEFDAWQQRSFDPNDAVAGTRWLSEHQAGTSDEQRAATLALAHADTPTITHLDSLGRAFLVQADNGPDPVVPGSAHRLYDTRSELDILGNLLSITDARGIITIRQRFDVLGRRLRVASPDAGTRLAVADVAGKPLRAWDNRGQTARARYDALQRPTHSFVAKSGTERLLLRTVYGESLALSDSQTRNLRTRPHLGFDCAGLVTGERFDFKGNLLSSSRRLAKDYTTEPNWTATENLTDPAAILTAAAALLETETFTTSSTYDALNRVTTHTTPDSSVTRAVYNEANLLDSLFASVRGAAEQPVITNLDYNARGQRLLCAYANSTTTAYDYDPKTFRLTQLKTLRGATKLQHLVYTHDPVGNIVALRDQSDTGPVFSGTAPVSGDGLYEYDPLYRLLSATGREHPATQPIDTDPAAGTGIPHANDLQALIAYSETYVYDPVGNIQQMAHVAGPSGSLGWTRNYQYAADSNRLKKTSVPGSPLNLSESYTYDQHGSMTTMPHLAVMDWDYADRLQHTQKGAGSGAQHTYFTYDGGGQRVRKASVASGTVKERIYLGGYELYRESADAPGAATDFERQTLHLMDDQRRVAMVETKTREAGAAVATPASRRRFQLENHLGSATLELDDAGSVISYEEYHPYGSTAFRTADGAAQVSAKRYRYTGKEKDEETGLYYHGARYYAPWLARWTAADPMGMADGTNVFAYVRCSPLRLKDPNGTQSKPSQVELPKVSPGSAVAIGTDSKGHPVYGLGDAGSASSNDAATTDAPIEIVVHGTRRQRSAPIEAPPLKKQSEERSFWSRGGRTLAFAAVTLGVGALILLSGPVGWFAGVSAALALAGGATGVGVGAVQLGLSYGGKTSARQDEELNRASSLTLSLSSPGGLAGGVVGVSTTGSEKGLERGALIGGLAEGGATLAYGGGRLLLRELKFGLPATSNWAAVRPLLRDAYELPSAAAQRVRANPAFPGGREWVELSHWIPQQWYKGSRLGEAIFNRPWNVTPMWGVEHALVDPSRLAFLKQPWQAAYAAEAATGVGRQLQLAPPSILQGAYGGFRITFSTGVTLSPESGSQ